MSVDSCEMCHAVASARNGQNFQLVRELDTSVLLVGNHQRFAGYCVLISKVHAREPFELTETTQARLFQELMQSARAIQAAFSPRKINYGCYGNQVPHVHWHIFPRYETDPDNQQTPWAQAVEFGRHPTSPELARDVAARIQKVWG